LDLSADKHMKMQQKVKSIAAKMGKLKLLVEKYLMHI